MALSDIAESLKGPHIKLIPGEHYNPQDPMLVVTHESNNHDIGQVSVWEHNQLLLEVLGFDGDRLLMRQFIVSSAEEIESEIHEYFQKLRT